MPTASDQLSDVADEVAAHFESVFADVETMQRALLARFATGPADSASVTTIVEPLAATLLDKGFVLGCGYVAAPGALTDHPLYLAWWQGESQQLLGHAGVPAGEAIDYTRREWYRVPQATGVRHVTGPYVDYVCTDEYVVTATMPVLWEGRLLGVVGADQLVERLEDLFADRLRQAEATLISEHGRVVTSADDALAPGDLVRLEDGPRPLPCGTLPLALLPATP